MYIKRIAIVAVTSTIPMFAHAVDFKISGQTNQALVSGNIAENATVVDNNLSGTRFRFKGSGNATENIEAGFLYEIQMQANQSSSAGASGEVGSDTQEVRWAEGFLKGPFGKISLGKGDSAAQGVADATYQNGNIYSSFNLIWLSYRGVYRDKIGDPNANLFAPFDAGGRTSRLRYDSPDFSGFSFSISADNNAGASSNPTAVAVRYKGNIPGGVLRARYGQRSDVGATAADFMAGSILYQHDSGFNIGWAMGERDDNANLDWNAVTLGYKLGKWGASFEFAENDNNQEVTSYGVTYNVAKGADVYFNSADFDVANGEGFLIGVRVKF